MDFWGVYDTKTTSPIARIGALLLSAAAAFALSISSFAASDADGVSVSVVVDRDSGITPTLGLTGQNGLDNKFYTISSRTSKWITDWQYQWTDFYSSSSFFGFKSVNGSIHIPLKDFSVPSSMSTVLYIPDFYLVFGFDVTFVTSCSIDFYDGASKTVTVNLTPTLSNRIVGFDEVSVNLGSGAWRISQIYIKFVAPNTVLTSSSSTLAISGFELFLTSSLSVSDFISQQTQDIIKNDVVPALDNMNQTMNDVNSSVEDVNQSVQAVEQAVQQGNQKLTELNNAVNNLPADVVSALDQKAEQEVDDLNNAADEALDDINNLIFGDGGFKFDTFTSALDSLKASFTSTVRADSITFPAGKLPNFPFLSGSNTTLWEEQTIDIKGMLDKLPPVFLVIVRSFFSISIIVAVIFSLCKFLSSLINSNVDDSEE